MLFCWKYILCIFGIKLIVLSPASICEEYGSTYGNDWLYFIDDYGTNRILNFSSLPRDTRDMMFGDAYFFLYTRRNIDEPEKIIIPDDNEPLISVNFNRSNDIRVVTHGWMSNANVNWLQKIKNSLLREYDLNVITIDWSELSKNIVYPFAAFSTRYVGRRVAKLLHCVTETYNVTERRIHLIGHSLGAHVMGYVGMFSSGKIYRATGLDPARPLFEIPKMPTDFRLDKSDAYFVDIVHTCGGVYGYEGSHGHADFYPNNGKPMQPGCKGIRQVADSCSHGRSHEYFEESIEYIETNNKTGFVAYNCKNWQNFNDGECSESSTTMGYHVKVVSRGNYYLRTRNESKYA